MVANIIRIARQEGLAVDAKLALEGEGLFGNASVTATRSVGGFDLAARTTFDRSGQRSFGTRSQFDPVGRQTGQQALTFDTSYPELAQRLTVDGVLAGGRLQAAAMLAHARLAEAFTFVGKNNAARFPKRTGRWRGELSADWARVVGEDYALKFLALTSVTDVDAKSFSQAGATVAALTTTDLFESRAVSRETIVRATLGRNGISAWRPEAGAEIAWNSLDNRAIASSYVAAPSQLKSEARVSETRADVFIALEWRPAQRWAVTAGAAYELSSLRARGDADREGRFGFLKPRLALVYRPDERSNLRLSVRRSVGQLSLSDFAASANLVEGKAYGGNADLVPDHRVSVALDYDRRFGRRGALNLNLFHDWRGDVLEAAVLPQGGFGAVNVPHARVWGGAANLELPVDRLAPGGLLKLGYAYQSSRIVDPVTGQRRGITGQRPQTLTVAFRQDLSAARFSWGLDYTRGFGDWSWYVDEARRHRRAGELGAYVETTSFKAAKIRLQVDGLLGTRNTYDRAQYATTRASAASGREIWDIRTPVMASVSLSRYF
ncbi:MAG: TonB-dependent receptor [Caulobacter sp.]|nr:TonB-dependent receptor [Caulobacter sp.]